MQDIREAREQLQATGAYMMANDLAWGNAGNISARTGPDRYLITAGGTYLGELRDDELVECSLTAGAVDPSGRRPSKELPMHSAVYGKRPDVRAVLHASPFYSTLIACTDLDVPSGWFVESMYYLERVERVPYAHPGSAELGEAVREKAGKANVLLLENHGVLVYDSSLKEARMALHALETACRMLIAANGAGLTPKELDGRTVSHFLSHSGYRPRRRWAE
ncbi:class II aldolase/adducin family protein [Paenibacillaceae bacterium WGS1546]|uniref:class II aldolase/adducin family protein n=1 Tax=Cohnella sp. WGS1546 TaxID=3366810 RepID=UPI00372D2A83